MIGRTLSHFKILAKIGEGGMGVVYRAEDEKLRRAVALKVLPPDLVANEERRLRFLRGGATGGSNVVRSLRWLQTTSPRENHALGAGCRSYSIR